MGQWGILRQWVSGMLVIHRMNDARFDLNLLVTLDALLAERNVTRAARRVGLTQPAMSNALARLRVALGDPVLVRAKGGMVPTAKAEAVGRAATLLLREVERVVGAAADFDARTARREFTIAASDYVASVLLTPLLERLTQEAPNIALRVVPLEPDLSLAKLEAGTLDFTLGFFRRVPSSLRRLRLFTDDNVGIAKNDHPIVRGKSAKCSVADLVSARHVRIAPQGEARGFLDVALGKQGRRREIALTSTQFLLAIAALDAGLVGIVPGRLARFLERLGDVRAFALPIALPVITVDAYWHARMHDEPAHAWLRKELSRAAERGERSPAGPRNARSRRR